MVVMVVAGCWGIMAVMEEEGQGYLETVGGGAS